MKTIFFVLTGTSSDHGDRGLPSAIIQRSALLITTDIISRLRCVALEL